MQRNIQVKSNAVKASNFLAKTIGSLLTGAAMLLASTSPVSAEPIAYIVDADTGNEMDDLYAVVQSLLDPDAKVVALNSAHFNNMEIVTTGVWHSYDLRCYDPVTVSQAENERLVKALGIKGLPMPLGADSMLGYSWGYFDGAPVPSAPAVDDIIARARAASPDKKLPIAVLGPLTNIAAAMIKAPDIVPKISVYFLGMSFKADQKSMGGVWDKNSFNVRNDLNAVDYVFSHPTLDLIIMPTETAVKLMFNRTRSAGHLGKKKHPVVDILRDRWDFVRAQGEWTMWDMALTYAITKPNWIKVEKLPRPPENGGAPVKVVTSIDAPAMEAHFWNLIAKLPDVKSGPVKPAAAQLSYAKPDAARAVMAPRRFGRQCVKPK
jgi:purine nucleosidase